MCIGMPGFKCVATDQVAGQLTAAQQFIGNVDKVLGLGVYTVPVIVAVVMLVLKKSVSLVIKVVLVVLAVMLILKYPVLGIVKNYL